MTRWLLALPFVLACAPPADDTGAGDDTDTDDTDTGEDVDPAWAAVTGLFEAKCASCHSGNAPPNDLSLEADVAYDELVDVPAVGDSSWTRVVCGDLDASALYQKVQDDPPFGDRMPLDQPALSEAEKQVIADWILADCPE